MEMKAPIKLASRAMPLVMVLAIITIGQAVAAENTPAAAPRAGVDFAEKPTMVLQQAQAGDPAAQREMGILYEYGFNMQGNKIEALAWYLLAASNGDAMAAAHRDRLNAELDARSVEMARKRAEEIGKSVKKTLKPSPPPAAPPAPAAKSDVDEGFDDEGPARAPGAPAQVPAGADEPPPPVEITP